MNKGDVLETLKHLESMTFEYTVINPSWWSENQKPYLQTTSYHRRELRNYEQARDEVRSKILECFEE